MARSTSQELQQAIRKLKDERQRHLDAAAAIDATFEELGIKVNDAPVNRGVRSRRVRKQAAPLATEKKKQTKGKRGRRRQTAEQWVLARLKGAKVMSTGELNAAWKQTGRGGQANNALTTLVKSGRLRRENIKGARGSRYSVA